MFHYSSDILRFKLFKILLLQNLSLSKFLYSNIQFFEISSFRDFVFPKSIFSADLFQSFHTVPIGQEQIFDVEYWIFTVHFIIFESIIYNTIDYILRGLKKCIKWQILLRKSHWRHYRFISENNYINAYIAIFHYHP